MHCEKAEMLLPLLVFEELADAEKSELMAHLAGCASCSEKLGDLRVTLNLLREGVAAEPAPVLSAERRAKLMKKLAAPPKVKRARRAPLMFPAWAMVLWRVRRSLGIAAGFALAVGIGSSLLLSPGGEKSTLMARVPAKDRAEDGYAATTYGLGYTGDRLSETNDVNEFANGVVPNQAPRTEFFATRDLALLTGSGSAPTPIAKGDNHWHYRKSGGEDTLAFKEVNGRGVIVNRVPMAGLNLERQEGQRVDGTTVASKSGEIDGEADRSGASLAFGPSEGRTLDRFGRPSTDDGRTYNMPVNPTGGPRVAHEVRSRTSVESRSEQLARLDDLDGAASKQNSADDYMQWAAKGDATFEKKAKVQGQTERTAAQGVDSLNTFRAGQLQTPETPAPLRTAPSSAPVARVTAAPAAEQKPQPAKPAGPGVSAVTGLAFDAPAQAGQDHRAKAGAGGAEGGEPLTTRAKTSEAFKDARRDDKERKDERWEDREVTKGEKLALNEGEKFGLVRDLEELSLGKKLSGKSAGVEPSDASKTAAPEGYARREAPDERDGQKRDLASQLDALVIPHDDTRGPRLPGGDRAGKELDAGLRDAKDGPAPNAAPADGAAPAHPIAGIKGPEAATPPVVSLTPAPEFDLNSALPKLSSGGSLGGRQSATTLFSDESESDQPSREEKIEQITTLIQDNVGSQSAWQAYGGEVSSLRELDGKLIIKTTPKQHREINHLLGMLRGKELREESTTSYFSYTGEDRTIAANLQKKVTLDSEGKQLKAVMKDLQQQVGGNFVVNWQALEAAGVEADLPITLNLKDLPAEKAVKLVLQQAGAAAELEPVDFEIADGVVKISTRRDLEKSTETRVYDVQDLLTIKGLDAKPEVLAQKLTEEREKAAAELQAEMKRQTEAARLAEAERARQREDELKRQELETQSRQSAIQEENAELQPAAAFRVVPVNRWTLAADDAQSTFALDVDTASYTLGRRYIQRGYLPPVGSVRMEEYVNAFDYNYSTQCEDVFNIHAEAAPAPFAPSDSPNTKLLKIGVKGKVIGRDGRKPANLVFVVDTSGSMARADRLPMIQHSLELLTSQLTPADTVSLVTFGSDVLTLLDRTPASQKEAIVSAVKSLQANGPTNLLKGVEAGYRLAEQAHKSGAINRVIVCSDGIATLGETEADSILTYVDHYRKQGISCTTVGFGAGAYDDDMMEKLANKGDGSYYFVDSRREAKRVFVDELTATLQTIAKDAKIQVEFNPTKVRRYRLIGYENRAIADKDFRNDTIDAGEVGSGQSSTALYEIELYGEAAESLAKKGAPPADLGTVYVRYRNADTEKIEEIAQRLTADLVRDRTPESAPRFYLAACAAEFAEVLRESEHATGGRLDQVQTILEKVVPRLPLDEKAAELLELVRKAQGLPRAP